MLSHFCAAAAVLAGASFCYADTVELNPPGNQYTEAGDPLYVSYELTPAAGHTLTGTTGSIDWGDGYVDYFDAGTASVLNFEHSYETPGEYTALFSGNSSTSYYVTMSYTDSHAYTAYWYETYTERYWFDDGHWWHGGGHYGYRDVTVAHPYTAYYYDTHYYQQQMTGSQTLSHTFATTVASPVPLPGVAVAGMALMGAFGAKRLRRPQRDEPA